MAWQINSRLAFLFCALFFSACNPQGDSTPQSNNANSNVLRLLYWQAPTILNPHLSTGIKDSEASRITLEPLASFDKDGELIPFLAAEIPTKENGGVAEDGLSVTWKLRQDVNWSDGTPFTANDVVFTYEFVSNPEVGTTTAGAYEVVESVEAIDDYTVRVNFKDVNPAWFLTFVGSEGMILPRHLFEDYNSANARQAPANLMPVGTGPYRVVEFKPGDVIVYEPNPEFRNADDLGFERLELKGGGDATSAARAVLQTGEADYAYNLQVEAPILQELEAAGQGKTVSTFGPLMERVLLNLTNPNQATADGEVSSLKIPHPFFTDKKVREAFSLAIDQATIAKQLYGPTGEATANFLVAPDQFVSANTDYGYNLEEAAALLDQAGWQDTNGNDIRDKDGTEMQVVFQTSVNPLRQKTQEIVKQGLQSIGVGVELKSIDPSIFFSGDPASTDTTERFQADLQMFTTGNFSPDPSSYMKTYTCDEIPQKSNNWTGDNVSRYCNQAYDALWQQATQELDSQKRQQLFIEMNDMLVQSEVVIPLVHRADTAGISNSLAGVELTPWDMNTWNIAEWERQ